MYRISQTDDLDLIQEMDALAFPDVPLPMSQIERAEWWVARDSSGKPVAYAGARPMTTVPGGAFLSRCAVIAEAQGHGLQRRLLRVRIAWAKRQGLTSVYTYTVPNNPYSANNLIKAGFLTYPDAYYGDDVVYWTRDV